MTSEIEIQDQVNKRLTLNLLIQSAAAHTFLTAHHLVRDELTQLHHALPKVYDRVSVSLFLNYFIGDIPLLFGVPSRFWNRVGRPSSPFRDHRLLRVHGKDLWLASKRHLVARGWQKRIIPVPLLHYLQAIPLVIRVAWLEKSRKASLSRLAEHANAMIWNIDERQLDGRLTAQVAFGNLRQPATTLGVMVKNGAVGFGGVEFRDGKPIVVAKAWFWPLLVHELVKGTAELVCLHGLNNLDDDLYTAVLERADHIEYETWMLQAGPALWRLFLAAMPHGAQLAEILMHVARLDPPVLESLMLKVITDTQSARRRLSRLA